MIGLLACLEYYHQTVYSPRNEPGAGQAVFAGGTGQASGDQYKHPVGKPHSFGFAQCSAKGGPRSQLVERGPDGEDRSPSGGIEDVEIFSLVVLPVVVAAEQSLKLGKLSARRSLRPRSATVRCLTLP
jgi:hypothetical protein